MLLLTVELLVDVLVLVLHDQSERTRTLVQQLLELYELKKKNTDLIQDEFCELYMNIIGEVMTLNVTAEDKGAIEALILKLKSNPTIIRDPELFTQLKRIFNDDMPFTQERKDHIEVAINNAIVITRNMRSINALYGKISTTPRDPEEQTQILKEISEICNTIIQTNELSINADRNAETQVRNVDFSSKDDMMRALNAYNTVAVKNRYNTGLQAMNRALGDGFPLGSSIVLNARSFNGKTAMLLKFARWQITLNKASSEFPNPLCLFYSLENEVPQNLMLMYKDLYHNVYKREPPEGVSDDEIAEFCSREFRKNGWHFRMERRLGAEFGFAEFRASFKSYQRAGYTPLMCIIDYANMMAKGSGDSSESSTNNLQIKLLYTNLCNYLKAQNCTFVTAHQLNRDADKIVAQNPIGAVRKFGPSMLSDSVSVQREVDIVFYQNKEQDSAGNSYLSFKLDKNRYNPVMAEKDRYFSYPFYENLGIIDDLDLDWGATDNVNVFPFQDKYNKIRALGDPELAKHLAEQGDSTESTEENIIGEIDLFG